MTFLLHKNSRGPCPGLRPGFFRFVGDFSRGVGLCDRLATSPSGSRGLPGSEKGRRGLLCPRQRREELARRQGGRIGCGGSRRQPALRQRYQNHERPPARPGVALRGSLPSTTSRSPPKNCAATAPNCSTTSAQRSGGVQDVGHAGHPAQRHGRRRGQSAGADRRLCGARRARQGRHGRRLSGPPRRDAGKARRRSSCLARASTAPSRWPAFAARRRRCPVPYRPNIVQLLGEILVRPTGQAS